MENNNDYENDKIIHKEIEEREVIINAYNTSGHLNREDAINKIKELRIIDKQVEQVTSAILMKGSIPFETASNNQIINELIMQVEILKSKLTVEYFEKQI